MKISSIEEKYSNSDTKMAKLIQQLDFASEQIDRLDSHLSTVKILLIILVLINFTALFFQLWTLLF